MPDPVAIVGMACRLPDAHDPDRLWENMLARRVSFQNLHQGRWNHDHFLNRPARDSTRTQATQAAHLDDVKSFAGGFFGMSPRRAEATDPQQRMMLEMAREALQDAGLETRAFDRDRTAVFVGASISEYCTIMLAGIKARQFALGEYGQASDPEALERMTERLVGVRAYTVPGSLLSMCATQVAQFFDFHGPAFTVDAACASGLVAVVQAVRYLREQAPGTVALAGGVYLNVAPDSHVAFGRIGALSREGCRPFDAGASGMVLGEGAAMVVLRRLEEAEAAGDRIYAVIRGVACNNDGASAGPMTPVSEGQYRVMRAGFDDCGLDPDSFDYIECHGTGTPVGDPSELSALARVMEGRRRPPPHLGSVKANLGHSLPAAGVSGLLRATLAVYKKTLPPQASFEHWHPNLAGVQDRFQVDTVPVPWEEPLRRATVSSFGFGGTNAFVTLENPTEGPAPTHPENPLLFVCSADKPGLLRDYLEQLRRALPDLPLGPAAYTQTMTRRWADWMVMFTARTQEDASARLHQALEALASPPEEFSVVAPGVLVGPRPVAPDRIRVLEATGEHGLTGGDAPLELKLNGSAEQSRMLAQAVARACGADISLEEQFPAPFRRIVTLPVVGLERAPYWVIRDPDEERRPPKELRLHRPTRLTAHPFALDPDAYPYLREHRLRGRPVLPLASAIDYFCWSQELRAPFCLSEVRVERGVFPNDDTRIRLRRSGDVVELLEVRPTGREVVGFRCQIASAPPSDPEVAPDGPERPCSLSLEEFYRDRTFHEGRLQGIRRVTRVTETTLEGEVAPSLPTDWVPDDPRATWHLDPLVLDSAFQLAMYHALSRGSRGLLPRSVERVVVRLPLAPEPVQVRLDLTAQDEEGVTGNLQLRQGGRLVAFLEGVRAHWVEDPESIRREGDRYPEESYRPERFEEFIGLEKRLQEFADNGLPNPYLVPQQVVSGAVTRVNGREVVNFAGYNYLGLCGHPEVNEAAARAIREFGTSATASRLVGGERSVHRELEQELSDFLGAEDAVAMVSGYGTNVSALGFVVGREDLVLHDALIHSSARQGALVSRATRLSFPHNDVEALERLLQRLRPDYRRVIVVVEGIYSMDGDVADLPGLLALRDRYRFLLMVDEAHSLGVLGATGRGLAEHYGVHPREVDLWMGTLSKSLASCGGYIAGCRSLVKMLKYQSPGFVFSVGMPPPQAAAALGALRVLRREPERVARLKARSEFFLARLREAGCNTGLATGTPVVPILMPGSVKSVALTTALSGRGIHVLPILAPAVDEGLARLRFFVTAEHTEEQLTRAAQAVAELTLTPEPA